MKTSSKDSTYIAICFINNIKQIGIANSIKTATDFAAIKVINSLSHKDEECELSLINSLEHYQITKCVHSVSVTARTGADYAARVRSPRHADASSYATHITGTLGSSHSCR